MSNILVVDIDQTSVDTASPWWEWMNTECNSHNPFPRGKVGEYGGKHPIEYDLSTYFVRSYARKHSVSSQEAHTALLSYWSIPTLYQNLKPVEGCYEALRAISEKGWWISFCSYTKKGHFGGKWDWVKETFDFLRMGENAGMYSTKEKGGLRATAVIDDRHEYLNQFIDPNVLKILYDTPFTQNVELEVPAKLVTHWDRLEEILT